MNFNQSLALKTCQQQLPLKATQLSSVPLRASETMSKKCKYVHSRTEMGYNQQHRQLETMTQNKQQTLTGTACSLYSAGHSTVQSFS